MQISKIVWKKPLLDSFLHNLLKHFPCALKIGTQLSILQKPRLSYRPKQKVKVFRDFELENSNEDNHLK